MKRIILAALVIDRRGDPFDGERGPLEFQP